MNMDRLQSAFILQTYPAASGPKRICQLLQLHRNGREIIQHRTLFEFNAIGKAFVSGGIH